MRASLRLSGLKAFPQGKTGIRVTDSDPTGDGVQPSSSRQIHTAVSAPTASAIRPAGMAWRLRMTPTEPK